MSIRSLGFEREIAINLLSQDDKLAQEVSTKIFNMIIKGFAKLPRIETCYIIKNGTYQQIASSLTECHTKDPVIFRFYVGNSDDKFNHCFWNYKKQISRIYNEELSNWTLAEKVNFEFMKLVVQPLKLQLDHFVTDKWYYRFRIRNCSQIQSLDVIFWTGVIIEESRLPFFHHPLPPFPVKGSVEIETGNIDYLLAAEKQRYENMLSSLHTYISCFVKTRDEVKHIDSSMDSRLVVDNEITWLSLLTESKQL